jgi:hypothetical protein
MNGSGNCERKRGSSRQMDYGLHVDSGIHKSVPFDESG